MSSLAITSLISSFKQAQEKFISRLKDISDQKQSGRWWLLENSILSSTYELCFILRPRQTLNGLSGTGYHIPLVKFQRSGAMDTDTKNDLPTAEEFKEFLNGNFELIMEAFGDFEKAIIEISDDSKNEGLRRIAFEELTKFYQRMQLGREKFSITLMEIRLKHGDRRGDEKLRFGFTGTGGKTEEN